MKSILHSHKKGVSELISYTLLIILAVSASVLVYNYLKGIVPKDKPTCEDNSLVMSSYKCTYIAGVGANSTLNITLLNKGRFTIDGVYLRIGLINQSARRLINLDNINLISGSTSGLKPQAEDDFSYEFPTSTVLNISAGDYALEIQPAMRDDNTKRFAACKSFVQTITCST